MCQSDGVLSILEFQIFTFNINEQYVCFSIRIQQNLEIEDIFCEKTNKLK